MFLRGLVAAMSSCNALPLIVEISPTMTAGCIRLLATVHGVQTFFTQVAGMALAPRLDTLAVVRPAEVILGVRFLQPATLTFRFALLKAGRF